LDKLGNNNNNNKIIIIIIIIIIRTYIVKFAQIKGAAEIGLDSNKFKLEIWPNYVVVVVVVKKVY
jgi:hypothetical protein